jgi:hypothetical protein
MAGMLHALNPDISLLSHIIVPCVVRHVAWKKTRGHVLSRAARVKMDGVRLQIK